MLQGEVTVLRRSNSALPVLFMSGAISRRQISGFRGRYLQKPFSQGELLQELHRLLRDN